MESNCVYPGSFTPPTYGHLKIIERAAGIFPAVTIICSTNPDKGGKRWFSEEECRAMWQHYRLPANVTVETLTTFRAKRIPAERIVMIRGVRGMPDVAEENRVMQLNREKFGVRNFFYLWAEQEYADISSSQARQAAEDYDFRYLAKAVAPGVVTELLKKVGRLKSLTVVVGKPGSGKSTFFRMVRELNSQVALINTDDFTETIKPLALEHFGSDSDLVQLAAERAEELGQVVAGVWFGCLAAAFRQVPPDSHLFVEVPYGLQPDKSIFRFLGNRIIHVGCGEGASNRARIIERGTPEHLPFVDLIPGREESILIAREHGLAIECLDLGGSLEDTRRQAEMFSTQFEAKEGGYRDVRDETTIAVQGDRRSLADVSL